MSDLDFIEACYAEAPSEHEWGSGLAERMARVVPEALAVMAAPYRVDAGGATYLEIVGDARYAADPAHAESSRRGLQDSNRLPQRQRMLALSFAGTTPQIAVLSDWSHEISTPVRQQIPWQDGDCIGLFGSLDGEQGFVVSPGKAGHYRLSRRRREQLTRLSEHLATGYWLRALRAPGSLESSADAVCTPDGKVLHHDVIQAPYLAEQLVDAVRGMDRARCRRQKHTPQEATELWRALLAGRYTLVESVERNGRRLILAVRCRTPRPGLTEREAAVAASAARGAANKAIAAELGLATSTVGVHLTAALRKLRCPNRRALSQWLAHAPAVQAD